VTTFDWKGFEAALFDELRRALERFAKGHRRVEVSSVALYGVYRELDGALSLPALGVNTASDGPPPDDPPSFWGARFNPPDWPHQLELCHRPAVQLERRLTAEATRDTVRHWRAVERRYFSALLRVTRALRAVALERLTCSADFVCFWHDEEGGPALAKKTIAPATWRRLFAREAAQQRERTELAKQPVDARAAFLVTRFGVFEGVSSEVAQKELLAMGKRALPALIGALKEGKNGWTAAKVLGQIGLATPEVISALRKRGDELWFAMALGMLGDHAWLAKQKPLTAVHGLTARLKAITAGGPPRPLDYRPLEAWLESHPNERKRVDDELVPGRSYLTIQRSDVDEALRALGSPFAVIRWHAAAVLGDRTLGNAEVILPRLVALFTDRSALVRRLAVLSVTRWKTAAKAHLAAIRALKDDSDPVVRSVAEQA